MIDRQILVEHLRKNYTLDAATGTITNKRGRVVKGSPDNLGYLHTCIRIAGVDVQLRLHQMVWALAYGRWPTQIDHENGIRTDNRIGNLREVTAAENRANYVGRWRPNAVTGLPGVSRVKGCYRNRLAGKLVYFADKYEAFMTAVMLGRMYGDS